MRTLARQLDSQFLVAVALGAWAAAVAITRAPAISLALVGPVVLAAVSWWAISGPTRWLMLYFACALLLPPLPVDLGGNTGMHLAPLAAALGLLCGVLRRHDWEPARGKLDHAFAAFLAVLLGSTALAAIYSGPLIAAGTLARVVLFAVGIYVFLYTSHGPRAYNDDPLRTAALLFWFALAAAAFACVDFYYQFPAPAGYGPQFVYLAGGVLRRAQGAFYEASTLGNLCAFFLVMIVVALSDARTRPVRRTVILAFGGVVFSAALVLSYSRASVVSVAVALVAFLLIRRRAAWKTVAILLVCPAVAALVLHFTFPSISDNYWQRLTASFAYIATSPDGVLSGRLSSWGALLGFLTREPWHGIFGIGYKTLPYSAFAGQQIIADNTYLSLLVETGVVGLAVFLFLNTAILRAAYRAARSGRARASFFGTWTFCFWCGQMVQMFSGDLITYWRVLPVYFWVLATADRESRRVE